MDVNLYTTTFNNEAVIQQFIDFYKQRIPNIRIYIHDMNSTDDTVQILKDNNCTVRNFSDFFTTKNDWKNGCWKILPCDCAIICNINEFIDIEPDVFGNCTLIRTDGYDITDLTNLTQKQRNINFDKYCIFDPRVIKNMNFEGGQCSPDGFVRIGEKNPKLYHLTKLKKDDNISGTNV